jgi:hypothetical protein
MKQFGTIALAFALLVLPVVTFAQFGEINDFLDDISAFINSTLIPLVFAAALLMFIYGMFKYFIMGGDDDGNRETGRQLMLWAIVGFVAMVSVFGVVNLLANGLGFSDEEEIQNIPNVPVNNS